MLVFYVLKRQRNRIERNTRKDNICFSGKDLILFQTRTSLHTQRFSVRPLRPRPQLYEEKFEKGSFHSEIALNVFHLHCAGEI